MPPEAAPGDLLPGGGLLALDDGVGALPGGGLWAADDRVLAFSTQASGGIVRLIYHGRQPQSANATLLYHPDGALVPVLRVRDAAGWREVRHTFGRVQMVPYGWCNTFEAAGLIVASALCVQGRGLVWRLQWQNRTVQTVTAQVVWRLAADALHRQVNGERRWRGPEWAEGTLRLSLHDRLRTRDWINVEGFRDTVIDADVWLRLAGDGDAQAEDAWALAALPQAVAPDASSLPCHAYLACGDDDRATLGALRTLQAAPRLPWQEQAARYAARREGAPALQVEGYPVAEAAYRLMPPYTEAAKVGQTGALRSSSGGYYFVWGWDNLMAAHDLTRSGDGEGARRLLDFLASHRAADGSIPHRYDNDLRELQTVGHGFISLLYISFLYHVYAETLDSATLAAHYPLARTLFEALAGRADGRGFFACLGAYPDAPEKLGRSRASFVAYEIGQWYTACRMMEMLARRAADEPTAQAASALAQRVHRHFLPVFFDGERGFLVDAVHPPADRPNGTYPRYGLFPLHNAFGAWLLRPALPAISRFVQQELLADDGIRMVPLWDAHAGTETVTRNCWFLHFDLYCLKAFRRAGDGHAVERWLRLADDYFTARGAIPELQMMGEAGDGARWGGAVGQVWQLFAMSGWTRGLLEGVLGLEVDSGGLTFIPCDVAPAIRVQRLPFRGGRWDVSVTGRGPWVERLIVDGQPVVGTYKLPAELYRAGAHHLEVQRGARPPAGPYLLEAVGGALETPQVDGRWLTATVQGWGEVNLVLYSPAVPRLWLDGQPVPVVWRAADGIGVATLHLVGAGELHVAAA